MEYFEGFQSCISCSYHVHSAPYGQVCIIILQINISGGNIDLPVQFPDVDLATEIMPVIKEEVLPVNQSTRHEDDFSLPASDVS